MKLYRNLALSMAMAVGAVDAASSQTALLHGEPGPNREARAAALSWFADQVAERTSNELKMDIQWAGALFKANASVQSIGDGVSDSGSIIGVYFPQEMAAYTIADLPLGNANSWVGMRATHELMSSSPEIAENLAEKNLVYISTWTSSGVNIGCNNAAIRKAEDVAGLKVRGVGAYGKVFGEMGANMVRMSVYEAYQGLDTGLLDCSQSYDYSAAAQKQYEVMTSYTIMNWGQIGGIGLFMNKDVYDALTAEQQVVLHETGSEMIDYFGENLLVANTNARQEMADAGLEIIEFPQEELEKLVSRAQPYIDQWVENANASGLPGDRLLSDYRGMIAKYTAELDAQGYPWVR